MNRTAAGIWLEGADADFFWDHQNEAPLQFSVLLMSFTFIYLALRWLLVIPISLFGVVDGTKELDAAQTRCASGLTRTLTALGLNVATYVAIRRNGGRFFPEVGPDGKLFAFPPLLAYASLTAAAFFATDIFAAMKRASVGDAKDAVAPTIGRNVAAAAVALGFYAYPIHGSQGALLLLLVATLSHPIAFLVDLVGELSIEAATKHTRGISLLIFLDTVANIARLGVSCAALYFSYKWYLDTDVLTLKALGDRDSLDQAVVAHTYRPIAIAVTATGLLFTCMQELQIVRSKLQQALVMFKSMRTVQRAMLRGAMEENKGKGGTEGPGKKGGKASGKAGGSGKKKK